MKVIVPVSGGKDSQACLKLALQQYGNKEVQGLFCDTLFEHPKTYDHIEYISSLYDVDIVCINNGSVEDKVLQYKRFPGGGARHCTSELKIVPTKRYLQKLGYEGKRGIEVWYGVRANESPERSKRYAGKVGNETYPPHEYMRNYPQMLHKKFGFVVRLPIIEWSYQDVMEYLDGEENPLYREGFDRVGCFPCLAGGDKAKIKAFEHDLFGKSQHQLVKKLEKQIDKKIFLSNIGRRYEEGNGCSFCSM